MIVIDMVSVQNLIVLSVQDLIVSLGKTIYSNFTAWKQAVLNFSHISTETKKKNKKFQLESNILASLKVGKGNCLTVA